MRQETVAVVLGTRNRGKVAEFKVLFRGIPVRLRSLADFSRVPQVEENGKTFRENAEKKAREYAKATNMIAVAEDSGLEVEYLGGAPGVRSARFAGERAGDKENTRKLLRLMEGVPWEQRRARFVCVICVADAEGATKCAEGVCSGRLSYEMRGTRGFGYDPIFVPDGYRKTMAELEPRVKNRISHRAEAMRAFRETLRDFLEKRANRSTPLSKMRPPRHPAPRGGAG